MTREGSRSVSTASILRDNQAGHHVMREIIPDRLWIGNSADVSDLKGVLDAGITVLVDLTFEKPLPRLTRDIVYCRFPIVDGAGNSPELLSLAVDTIVSLQIQRIPTLVFCGAGMSRSPALVAAAMAIVRGQSPEASLKAVTAGGSHDVSASLWRELSRRA